MIIENLYSRKYKKENGLFPDIFTYDPMPVKLKITLTNILKEVLPECSQRLHKDAFQIIHNLICEEHSYHYLENNWDDVENRVLAFFNTDKEILIDLDILNIALDIINATAYQDYDTQKYLLYIQNINQRMLEHGFGYQYENKNIIRIDTKHTHSEIVKPALALLTDSRFKNANNEYRKAYDAFKNTDYETAISESNKAFESTMKIICDINNYEYNQNDTANKLINILAKNSFIEEFNTDMLNGLKMTLKNIPTIRNKMGGHGSGIEDKVVSISYVNFALHSTATNILFLLERNKEINGK